MKTIAAKGGGLDQGLQKPSASGPHPLARLTQEERILELLKERGNAGAYVYEFMTPQNMGGCGISQYGARIYSLRRKGHMIKNITPGHFVLEEFEENGQGRLV